MMTDFKSGKKKRRGDHCKALDYLIYIYIYIYIYIF